MYQIAFAEQSTPAEVAKVAVYWPEVMERLETPGAADAGAAVWAQGLPYLAEQLDLPKAEVDRAKALAERLKPR
jgi:hypothetical protein